MGQPLGHDGGGCKPARHPLDGPGALGNARGAMQLLLLLSAIMTALTGVVTGRAAAPQPVVAAGVEAATPAAVVAAVAVAAMLRFGGGARQTRVLPRPFNLLPTIAIYLGRMRR